ncbi:MAG: Holliday junction resolvase-like protein [Spirochaetia bacterium]|jgi:predicted Holliday junction resolvase-like endonuclease
MPGLSDVLILLGLVAAVALLALVLVVFLWQAERRRGQSRIEQLLQEHERNLSEARRESVQKSRSSLKGQIAEQMAPLLPGFRYLPADARFLGDPIDYLVFSGYTDLRDNRTGASDLDIVLLEVKQGASSLSPLQRAIAKSVQEGRVRFEILRISEEGALSSETWHPRNAAHPRGAGEPRRLP